MTNTPGDDQEPQPGGQEPQQAQPWFSPGYGQGYPPYAPPPGQYAPDHPRATTVLVLGILGVVLCQVLGPFAWVMGRRTLAEIDAEPGRYGGRGAAQAGYVLGIVGTVILGLSVLVVVFYLVVAVALLGGVFLHR